MHASVEHSKFIFFLHRDSIKLFLAGFLKLAAFSTDAKNFSVQKYSEIKKKEKKTSKITSWSLGGGCILLFCTVQKFFKLYI